MDAPPRADDLPPIIQGGMGVAVSGWELARAVASTGQLGVVSGTALEVVHARRLADGDPGGHLRRAYATFPVAAIAEAVLERWFVDGGRDPGHPYRPVPMFTTRPTPLQAGLTALANYAEVWLAKDGHDGPIGVNYLEKIQIPTPFAAYGALLAGVDAVLMGAGIPSQVPRLLDSLARGEATSYRVDVEGATAPTEVHLDPAELVSCRPPILNRPPFLAIVASHTLAAYLAKDPATRPDGVVIEGRTAGGHNAPPRGKMRLDDRGQPVYGPRDVVDLDIIDGLGIPFWLAGGHGVRGAVAAARETGAHGIQVGTAFALCAESGLDPDLKASAIAAGLAGHLEITTDPLASPSGYPFKIAGIDQTLSQPAIHEARDRVCDLGFLRTAFERPDGTVGFRCPSEPIERFTAKGGGAAATQGRICLCNGLTAAVGLGQTRSSGEEPPLVTLGDDAAAVIGALASPDRQGWTAAEVVEHLLAAPRPLSPDPGQPAPRRARW